MCASADTITKANYFFTLVFTLEAVLKITGQGWQVYIRNIWNKFDFFIVVAGIFDVVLSFFENSFTKVVIIFRIQKILRLLRITRMIKLVKGLKARPCIRLATYCRALLSDTATPFIMIWVYCACVESPLLPFLC